MYVCVCSVYQSSVVHFLSFAGPERQVDYLECCTAVTGCHSFQGKRKRMEERGLELAREEDRQRKKKNWFRGMYSGA